MPEVLKKFGRYFLMDHIAQGGMAEIFRARLASVDGGGRILVIKRIQSGFGSNPEFVQMFRSEIKVTMGFNHPNICQLFDFGEESHQPYIAMEYLDGKNIRQLLSKLNESKKLIPVEMACYIAEQAASGLAYAHAFKDKITGEALNIVHRDISPQNILVSYDGGIKVIDFGIAKAANNVDSTRAGVIKGKPSYLSPEQIAGEVLDGRCDVFALGIVLWEMLTGRKLFAAEGDLAILKLIEACQTHVKPPSSLNPAVPKELDYIVLRSLAKSREKRFQTAEEFHRTLRKFLVMSFPEFSPTDLSSFSKELFREEILADRKYLQDLSKKVDQLLFSSAAGQATEIITPASAHRSDSSESATEKSIRGPDLEASQASEVRSPAKKMAEKEIQANISSTESVQLDLAELRKRQAKTAPVAVGSQPSISRSQVRKTPTAFEPSHPSIGSKSRTLSNEIVRPKSSKGQWVAVAAAVIGGIVFGPQAMRWFSGTAGRQMADNSEVSSAGISQETRKPSSIQETVGASEGILLRIDVAPGGSDSVTVNGQLLDKNDLSIRVKLDTPLELEVEKEGFIPVKREFVLESRKLGTEKTHLMKVIMEPSRYGYLTIYTSPSAEATLSIEGRAWTRKTPFEREKLPAGTYSVKLSNELLGMEKTIKVTIEEGKVAKFTDERLEIKN